MDGMIYFFVTKCEPGVVTSFELADLLGYEVVTVVMTPSAHAYRNYEIRTRSALGIVALQNKVKGKAKSKATDKSVRSTRVDLISAAWLGELVVEIPCGAGYGYGREVLRLRMTVHFVGVMLRSG